MGRKITIDSATLFNKGLEMIEARWLFDVGMSRVGVVVHPQSIVNFGGIRGWRAAGATFHSGHVPADSIRLDLSRSCAEDRVQTNFAKLGNLTFEEPDAERFPALLRAGQGRRAVRCRRC